MRGLRHQRLRTCFRNSAVFFILDDAGAGSGACRRQVAFRDIHTSLRAGVDFPLHITHHSRWWLAGVVGATFSDSATVPEFLNPGPAIFQIRKSDSCSDSAATVIDLPENGHWPSRLLLLPKWKSDSGSGFSQILTPDPGPKEKCRILPQSSPAIRIRSHLWWSGSRGA